MLNGSRRSTGDFLFKVVMLGDSKVGKSSIVSRLAVSPTLLTLSQDKKFSLEHKPTFGYDMVSGASNFGQVYCRLQLENYRAVTLQLYDTAGMDRFNSLNSSYFK